MSSRWQREGKSKACDTIAITMQDFHDHSPVPRKSLSVAVLAMLVLALGIPTHPGLTPAATQKMVSETKVVANRYADAVRRGQAAVRALMKMAGIPGLSVAIAVDGEIIWSEGFGYADLEHRVPVTPLTLFRIASVSKVVTASAVAKLHEEGKLDLDAPIQRYVPTFPEKGYVITTRELAGQLGGIRHYDKRDFADGRNIDFKHYDKVSDSLTIFKDDPLVAPPGTRYSYSTFGYTLLSAVVEGASGQDFLTYLREHVFEPLRMRHTVPDDAACIVLHRAGFYQRGDNGQITNAPYLDSSYKWGAGGLLSTAEDVALFGSSHLRPGFLKSETLSLLFTSQRTSSGQQTGVGIGWRIMTDSWGRPFVHHSGSQQGSRSVLVVYRDAGVAVALATNLTGTPILVEGTAQALGEAILRVVEGRQVTDAKVKPAGIYDYTLETSQGKDGPASGIIEITCDADGCEGWMTNPKPLSEYAARNKLPIVDRLQIISVAISKTEGTAIVASPLGLCPLRARFEDGGFAGTMRAHSGNDPVDWNIRASKRAKSK